MQFQDQVSFVAHMNEEEREFAASIREAGNRLRNHCFAASWGAGWWTDMATGKPMDKTTMKALVPTKLMLTVSELSEAMEGDRKDLMDDHLPWRKSIEVELADAVIRIADLAGALNLDLGGAIAEKMHYNAHRNDHKLDARAAAGGKRY